jgi:hypothetical protein
MKVKNEICENCKQISFVPLPHTWQGKNICFECYSKLFDEMYNWQNINLAFEISILYTDEIIYLPLIANCENLLDIDQETTTIQETLKIFEDYIKDNFYGLDKEIDSIEIIDIRTVFQYIGEIDLNSFQECEEFFRLIIFKDLAFNCEMYERPFDNNPTNFVFSCSFAWECYTGNYYSKDFGYYYCEDCDRYVCIQNPSNGWHVQGHFNNYGFECNKCYEERTLINGINEEFNGENIPGQFYNTDDILSNNWELYGEYSAGHGYDNYTNPENSIDLIDNLIKSGFLVLVNYTNMAIGGMGGYFDIYVKQDNIV